VSWRSVQLAVKRGADLTLSSVAIVVTAPVMLAVALAIRYKMGAPVLYGQLRPGLDEQPIKVWKFRTMTQERGPEGALKPDSERLTPMGRFLREHSLDELPQLFNIFMGSMSIVGPRPLLARYLPRYTARQLRRQSMKPGITGWAQVNGRNALDWHSRLELDVWYVENFSLLLDAKIMLLTVLKLLSREGVLAGAGAELDEYWGPAGPPPDGPRAFPVEAAEGWIDAPPRKRGR
jgi:lipopolysaccharide/colanic/teichoic acid biosynthesis glycosyltransferase